MNESEPKLNQSVPDIVFEKESLLEVERSRDGKKGVLVLNNRAHKEFSTTEEGLSLLEEEFARGSISRKRFDDLRNQIIELPLNTFDKEA